MKRYIAVFLLAATLFSLTACRSRTKDQDKDSTKPSVQRVLPNSALSLLETVWTSYGENYKFPAMGGSYDEDESKSNHVDGAPGKFDLENEGLTGKLMVPEAEKSKIAEAASLVHGMMLNNFTCGAYKMANGGAKAFGEAMYKSIIEQRFLCGSPEAVLVATMGDEYVVAAFGAKELMDTLQSKLTAAYPGTQVLYSKLIPA